MGRNSDRKATQAAHERDAFTRFAEDVGLPVVRGSITSREEPEPDILCEMENEGPVAFELVTIDSDFLRQDLNTQQHNQVALARHLPPGSRGRRELEAKFGRVLLHVYFSMRSNQRERDAVLSRLIYWLVKDGQLSSPHSDHLTLHLDLRASIDRVIHRGPADSFRLEAGQIVTSATTTIFLSLRSKLKKRYSGTHHIELLAYTWKERWGIREQVKSQLVELISDELPSSAFRRIWVADLAARPGTLKFVTPEPACKLAPGRA